MAGLSEEVGLDISSALASIDELASAAEDTLTAALVSAADSFASAMADATSSTASDQGSVFEAIGEQAITASGGVEQLSAASVDASTAVEGLGSSTDTATTDLSDLSEIAGQAAQNVSDVSTASQDGASAVGGLGDAAASAGDSASTGGGKFDVFGASATAVGGAMNLAKGNTQGVTESLRALPGGLGAAAGGFAAVGVAAGAFFDAGLKVQTQQDRLNLVFGDFKDKVENIDVGGLTGSLDDLSVKAGSTGVGLGLTAANIGQLAQTSGVGQSASAELAQHFEALTLKAAALNPALGGADAASNRLFTALLSGRDKALAPFALGIDAASIKTEAYSLNLEKAGVALTPLDKLIAGVTLATEKAGDTLGSKFAQGADLAGTKARALRAELEQTIEKLGQPVVSPFLALGTELVPVAEQFGSIAATVVTAFLPAIRDVSQLLVPLGAALTVVGDVLEVLSPLIGPVAEGFVAFKVATIAGDAVKGLAVSFGLIPGASVAATAAMGIADEAVVAFTTTTVAGVTAVETASGLLIPASAGFLALGAAADTAAVEVETATTAMDINPIFLVATALAGAAVAFGLLGGGADTASHQVDGFTTALENANGKLDESATKAGRALFEERNQVDDLGAAHVTLAQALDATSSTTSHQRDTLGQLGDAVSEVARRQNNMNDAEFANKGALDDAIAKRKELVASLRAQNPALGDVVASLLKENGTNSGVIGTLADLANGHADVTQKLKDQTKAGATNNQIKQDSTTTTIDQTVATTAAAQAMVDYAAGTSTAAETVTALSNADADLKASMDLLLGNFLSVDQARIAYTEGLTKLNVALFATGLNLDSNTQAGLDNQKSIDQQAASAVTWSSAITKAGGTVAEAQLPLQAFSGDLQKIRDAIAAGGGDTSFVDNLLVHVNDAIAGVAAKAPAAAAAGKAVGDAGWGGIRGTLPAWLRSGQDVGQAAADGVTDWKGVHKAAGHDLSLAGAGGFSSATGAWVFAGAASGGGAAGGIESKWGDAAGAGHGLSGAGSSAAGGHYDAWFGAGTSSASGFAAGIDAITGEVTAAASAVADAAVQAIKNELVIKSPSQVMRDEVGAMFGQGFVLGIEDTHALAASAGATLGSTAASSVRGALGGTGTVTARSTGGGGASALDGHALDVLADKINRAGGINIEHATFGDRDVVADLDYWAKVRGAGV